MKLLLLLAAGLGAGCAVSCGAVPDFGLLNEEEISFINTDQGTSKAERSVQPELTRTVKNLMGVDNAASGRKRSEHTLSVTGFPDLPENFDAREKWTKCPTLTEVHDQGNCEAGYAFAVVEAMSDRICIASGATKVVRLSVEDVLTCCSACGDGCNGGILAKAWSYYVTEGVVTGGMYNSLQGCQSYSIPPCDHHQSGNLSPCRGHAAVTPRCNRQCETDYNSTFQSDKHYGKSSYRLRGEENIRQEVYTNGPVTAEFTVYSDFLLYKSGVYKHTNGTALGVHAVKILGYGVTVDNATEEEYWLVANSWNRNWGDGGFFKIRRGTDECGIEGGVMAGEPKL